MSNKKTSQPISRFADGTLYVQSPLSVNFQKSNYLLGQTIAGLFAKSPIERWLFVTLIRTCLCGNKAGMVSTA